MGLLSRANTLDELKNNPGLAFSDFINKHSLKICALLEKKVNNYIVTNSIGFDAESIISATSTVDFWDGICKEAGKVYYFKDTDKTQLLQLFSFNQKDNFTELSVYKNTSSQILIYAGLISDKAAKDFDNISNNEHKNDIQKLNPLIKKSSVVLLFKINFSEAIKGFYTAHKETITDFDFFQKTLMHELYNRFTCKYNIPDTSLLLAPDTIKTIFVTGKEYSVELITHHIILNLKEVFNDSADYIQVCFAGTANSCDKVQSFLQAE